MNINNVFRKGAQAFNSVQSALGLAEQKPTYTPSPIKDLSSDLIQIDMRETDLVPQQIAADHMKSVSSGLKRIGAPILAAAGAVALFAAAPIAVPAALGGLAALTFVAGGVDEARADIKHEEILAEKKQLQSEKEEAVSRYEAAQGAEKHDAWETIQEIRQDRKEFAAELKEQADVSWGMEAREYEKGAGAIEGLGTFLARVKDAPADYQPPAYLSDLARR